jgi:oxygen-dependent protoporphyrinogen oxidase
LALVDELGMRSEVVSGGPAPRQTFVMRDHDLRPLPYGMLNPTRSAARNLMASPLLSLRGKARMALEPLIGRRRDPADESVAAFVRRRFGTGMLEELVDPLLGGIHGDGAEGLSAEMVLPALRRIELEGKSVALRALRTRPSKSSDRLPPLVTLRRGMGSLIDTLAVGLPTPARLGVRVESLARSSSGWEVATTDGPVTADGVILAVAPAAASALLSSLDAELGRLVGAQPMSSSRTVTFMWEPGAIAERREGTGFLVPRSEGGHLAACTWVSSKWEGRSADGAVMMRCFMREVEGSDADVAGQATAEVARTMGVTADPTHTIVRQWDAALPVMQVGHRTRIDRIHERLARSRGLELAGAGLEGGGLPACVRSGRLAASRLLAELDGTHQPAAGD